MLAAAKQMAPSVIVVDKANVYFTASGASTIQTVPVGGGAVRTIEAGQNGITSIAVDATNVYWSSAGMVLTAPIAGGSVTTLVKETTFGCGLVVGGGNVYWGDNQGVLFTVPSTGGTPTAIASDLGVDFSVLAIDGTNVYWIDFGVDAVAVMKQPLAGGAASAVVSGLTNPLGEITASGSDLYFTTETALQKAPISGGSATTITSDPEGFEYGQALATVGTNVYWTKSDGSLQRAPTAGGPIETLPGTAGSLVGYGDSLYWCNGTQLIKFTPN